jgi:hypothetical protein
VSRTYRRRGERHEYRWVLLRWFSDPDYNPVMQSKHRHGAKWAWW